MRLSFPHPLLVGSGHVESTDDYVCIFGRTYSKNMDQLGKIANPARGQLNRENGYFPVRVRA